MKRATLPRRAIQRLAVIRENKPCPGPNCPNWGLSGSACGVCGSQIG